MEQKLVYADNAATAPLRAGALAAMLPYFQEKYANPSAMYPFAHGVKSDVENARKRVARCLNARPNEIYFTSGGTESDNWALWGAAEKRRGKGRHIVTAAAEHSAVYKTCLRMEEAGFEVTYLPVDGWGSVAPDRLREAIRPDTFLVSLMMANNEVGTLLPIGELCAVARERKSILFHTDAVQAVGHLPVDVRALGVDLLSLSAHKFGGPKGVGALYIRMGLLPAFMTGGGQERGQRSGTTNVPGVMGMAAALEEACAGMAESARRVAALRDRLIEGVLRLTGAVLTGSETDRLPGLASFVFEGLQRPPLIAELGAAGICASAGSSCSAGSGDPSRVLLAAGLPQELALSSVRFSLSEGNTEEDVDYILEQLPLALARVQQKDDHFRRVFG